MDEGKAWCRHSGTKGKKEESKSKQKRREGKWERGTLLSDMKRLNVSSCVISLQQPKGLPPPIRSLHINIASRDGTNLLIITHRQGTSPTHKCNVTPLQEKPALGKKRLNLESRANLESNLVSFPRRELTLEPQLVNFSKFIRLAHHDH